MNQQNKSSRDDRKKQSETQSAKSVVSATPKNTRASFFRRLLSMVYDTLVAIAIGMCAAMVCIVALMIMLSAGVLSMQGFENPSELIQSSFQYKLAIQIWVVFWVALFFLWFWKKGGQTLGMRAWRLRIFSTNDKPMTWGRLTIRLIASLGGLGTLLVLFDWKHKQSLQDRISHTEVIRLTKEANDHKQW